MENGYDGKLVDRFSGLALSDSPSSASNDGLFQVMKAVEAAETTIKLQVEENNRLRIELEKKAQELAKYRPNELVGRRSHPVDPGDEHVHGLYKAPQSVPSVGNQEDRIRNTGNTSVVGGHSESSTFNGALKVHPGSQGPTDDAGFFHVSSPSTTSFSHSRYQVEGEHDLRFNSSGHGLMPMTEVNNPSSLWKQDLVLKIQEHEEEIKQLRKQLAEYSIKEAQIRNEKYVLEKRIAYMRLAFDQQQQDLVDAASKALSYRQDIIEENIRLSYALQDAQQERSTFVSSLLPLLAEYSLQPPVADAQSIVSNLKVLFKHLQEKLYVTETKLKESQFQLAPWRSDVNHSNFSPQSPPHSIGAALTTSIKNGLELVPQPAYSPGMIPSSSDVQTPSNWNIPGHHQSGFGGMAKNLESEDLGRYSPPASRNSAAQEVPAQITSTHGDSRATRYSEETASKQVTFSDPVSSTEMDDPDAEGHQNEREPSTNWVSGSSPYTAPLEDPSSYSPYLPPVLEEPSSSFSEAADDDPLPAIRDLQIAGDALPGQELQACGYSINGTTSCNFEWVRHLEDGSVNYIDGAKQPNYLVTADDVDTYLAIEVQPLDHRMRKGELVKVFANEHRKITCDSEMQSHIEKTLVTGHTSYKVSLSAGYLDIWEPATLAIKREGYSIKCTGPSGAVVSEKFSSATNVSIPYGHPEEFLVIGSGRLQHHLRVENISTDVSCSRDAIVLILRCFIRRAGEKRKGKKRSIFFSK